MMYNKYGARETLYLFLIKSTEQKTCCSVHDNHGALQPTIILLGIKAE